MALGRAPDQLKVVSASRRVDMVFGYRNELIEILGRDWPPDRVHTVVIWTKHPAALAHDEGLKACLKQYDQIFLHLTITGLGGTLLEPLAPAWRDSVKALPDLVHFAGDPARARLRVDPLIEAVTAEGRALSNVDQFEEIAAAGLSCGIRNVSTSWVTSYDKVQKRLASCGMEIRKKTPAEMEKLWQRICGLAAKMGVVLHGCCAPGLPSSRCIDGELLRRLHPGGNTCSTKKAKGQRPLCGCTESFDVGWYKPCPTGCVYCYGNPAVR